MSFKTNKPPYLSISVMRTPETKGNLDLAQAHMNRSPGEYKDFYSKVSIYQPTPTNTGYETISF